MGRFSAPRSWLPGEVSPPSSSICAGAATMKSARGHGASHLGGHGCRSRLRVFIGAPCCSAVCERMRGMRPPAETPGSLPALAQHSSPRTPASRPNGETTKHPPPCLATQAGLPTRLTAAGGAATGTPPADALGATSTGSKAPLPAGQLTSCSSAGTALRLPRPAARSDGFALRAKSARSRIHAPMVASSLERRSDGSHLRGRAFTREARPRSLRGVERRGWPGPVRAASARGEAFA